MAFAFCHHITQTPFLRYAQPPLLRVHEAAAGHDSEVQVRSGGVACAADLSDILPARNLLPAFYINLAEMAVKRLDVIAVIDDYALPVTPVHPGKRHGA